MLIRGFFPRLSVQTIPNPGTIVLVLISRGFGILDAREIVTLGLWIFPGSTSRFKSRGFAQNHIFDQLGPKVSKKPPPRVNRR
jgi:hypothetical protein